MCSSTFFYGSTICAPRVCWCNFCHKICRTGVHNNAITQQQKSFYLSENLLLYLNNRYCVSDNFQYSKKNRVLFFDLGYSKSGNAFDKFHGHTVFYKQSQIKSQTLMFYLNLPCSSTLARFQILHLMFLQIF